MYPHTQTHTEELRQHIEEEAPLETSTIKAYIDQHDTNLMDEGERYYFNQNDILDRKIYTIKNGEKVVDLDATNNRIPSGWHKLLVDQKTSYLVGSALTVGYEDEEKDIQPLLDIIGDEFDDTMPELVKKSSNKGLEWLHPFIDSQGEFDYLVVPAQEFIPIYDNSKRKNLIGGIRLIPLDHDDIIKIEFWNNQTVRYFEMINGQVYEDFVDGEHEHTHFSYGEDGYGWGKVPFVPFKNNEECVSDLTFYKKFIDAFDKAISDTTNTLEDIQDFVYILKGYEGQDLEEFMTNLKRYKVISVSDEQGAGVDTVRGEVPVQAVESQLNRLRDSIFQFGQGVDVGADKFGNAPSGIALKFLFSLLDMKADVLERKFTKALKEFMWFVTEYAYISTKYDENKPTLQYDPHKVTFIFNKSTLMNEKEQAEIAQMSKGIISDQTTTENHPWATSDEARRMEEQNESMMDLDQPLGEDDE